ncbi:MFS transporter [Streptomyces mirabilis]|uniref:MFS transporter n=1 Tax=Streptomyces mirabilis TaxID=68239 RepID=UPI0036C70FC1
MTLLKTATEPADDPLPRVGYRDVLREPYAKRLLAGTLIGRLPTGMAPLAILVTATHAYGTASGAALAALYLLASAVGGPLIGRQVDRHGQTVVFAVSAALSNAGLLLVAAQLHQPWCAVTGVSVAGATKATLDSGLRALWGSGPGSVMPTPAHQRTALALDATSQEMIHIVGPLLVAALTMTGPASGALLATAALGVAGTAMVVATPCSRSWPAAPGRRADWLGPLRSEQLCTLYVAMAGVGVPMGALTPRAAGAAAQFGSPMLSGALPAVLSAGAVAGGFVYGSRTWPGTPIRHLIILAVSYAVGWLPLTLAGSATTAVLATAVPGLVMAPLLGCAFVVTGEIAPHGTVTEAHALLVASLDVGCAAGAASAGLVPATALLPAGAAAGALVLVATRHRLTVTGRPPLPANPLPRGSLS